MAIIMGEEKGFGDWIYHKRLALGIVSRGALVNLMKAEVRNLEAYRKGLIDKRIVSDNIIDRIELNLTKPQSISIGVMVLFSKVLKVNFEELLNVAELNYYSEDS